MRKYLPAFLVACLLALLAAASGGTRSASAADAGNTEASGSLVGGLRVLDVPEGAGNLELKVFRGDYVKFRYAANAADSVLAVPDLAVQQKLPARWEEAPYVKMERSGVFPFSLGGSRGTIVVSDYRQANYREVGPKEAVEVIRNVQPLILDVRTPAEYGRGRIQGSVLIPVQQLEERWTEISGYKDRDVLIYCATGNRSTVAAKILIDRGFKRIMNLRQGIAGWQRDGQPVAP